MSRSGHPISADRRRVRGVQNLYRERPRSSAIEGRLIAEGHADAARSCSTAAAVGALEGVVIETEGLTHIHLFVADLNRSLRFYCDVFGFEEMFRDGPTMVFLRPRTSADTVTLNEVPEKAGKPGGVDHFGFRLADKTDLDRAIVEVERAGGRLLERGERSAGGSYAYVADPDGYMIEL